MIYRIGLFLYEEIAQITDAGHRGLCNNHPIKFMENQLALWLTNKICNLTASCRNNVFITSEDVK